VTARSRTLAHFWLDWFCWASCGSFLHRCENKSYEWDSAQIITLSVSELGDVLAFDKAKDVPELKIFHDPGLGSSVAGQVRKELVVKRIGGGKPGYFFNFSVTNKDDSTGAGLRKWSIAVTEGEWNVLLTLIQQTLPDLLALSTKPQLQREDDFAQGQGQQQAQSSDNAGGNGNKRWNK